MNKALSDAIDEVYKHGAMITRQDCEWIFKQGERNAVEKIRDRVVKTYNPIALEIFDDAVEQGFE